MCGIVGFVNADGRQVEPDILAQMNQAIFHRGPDEDGFYLRENVGMAMRRLAIIDLAGGQQPIFNEDRTKAIVFNGEIYNFQELRRDLEQLGHRFETRCDTEIIVHLYDRYGADCVRHLRGMFVFAIWNERDKSLFIARDRIGKKPLLYSHQSNGDLVFGSEFRALLQHPNVSRDVDFGAIDNYLSYLSVPAPQTAFRQIRKLEPAHWLRWKNGEIETQRYWLPDFSKKVKISETEAEEETLRIVRESTKLRMISDVPLGAFLSGGVDSSTIVALMAQESSQPVKTFSIGFEEEDFNELSYARRVAEHVGAEHHEFVVRPDALEVLPLLVEHYGEPYADWSAIPTFYVARETRKYVTVALNGDGGDECFAGYERHAAMNLAEKYRKIPAFLRQSLIENAVNLMPHSETKGNRTKDLKRFLKAAGMPAAERYYNWVNKFSPEARTELYTTEFRARLNGSKPIDLAARWFEHDGLGAVDAALLADTMTYLPNDLMTKVDIATMAVSLEGRSPFLDHKVIEFAASLPENIKIRGMETKRILKRVAAKLVPREVVYRRKMGFRVPISSWFRTSLKDFLQETLLSEKSFRRGIFQPQTVQRMFNNHIAGKEDNGWQLWTLLMLELWFESFID